MIERKFVADKLREFRVQEYVSDTVKRVGHSKTKLQKTPLGEKIIIYTSRPGLIVGRKGQNIKKITKALKREFKLENPQLEIAEIENPYLDSQIVAENIANSLERFGSQRFKGVGHKMMSEVMGAGARGIEILISGKIPSSRARRWRFYQGYLKKSGDIAITGVHKAIVTAELKTGTVGIQVRIMAPDARLPDDVRFYPATVEDTSEESEDDAEENKPSKGKEKTKASAKKKAVKKKSDDDDNDSGDELAFTKEAIAKAVKKGAKKAELSAEAEEDNDDISAAENEDSEDAAADDEKEPVKTDSESKKE